MNEEHIPSISSIPTQEILKILEAKKEVIQGRLELYYKLIELKERNIQASEEKLMALKEKQKLTEKRNACEEIKFSIAQYTHKALPLVHPSSIVLGLSKIDFSSLTRIMAISIPLYIGLVAVTSASQISIAKDNLRQLVNFEETDLNISKNELKKEVEEKSKNESQLNQINEAIGLLNSDSSIDDLKRNPLIMDILSKLMERARFYSALTPHTVGEKHLGYVKRPLRTRKH